MWLAIALAVASVPAGPAEAATLGNPSVGFTAERTLVFDGKTYVGRMWSMPGEQRHEQDLNAFKPVFILHDKSALGDLVVPQLHTVVEFDCPQAIQFLSRPGLLGRPLGPDRVNGVATTKYAIDDAVPGGRAVGTLWLSRDGIPMRADGQFAGHKGKIIHVHWELSHVHIGPQPAALFEVPRDFSRLPAEAVAPLLGMRLKGPH
jgi:hypothetical protein